MSKVLGVFHRDQVESLYLARKFERPYCRQVSIVGQFRINRFTEKVRYGCGRGVSLSRKTVKSRVEVVEQRILDGAGVVVVQNENLPSSPVCFDQPINM